MEGDELHPNGPRGQSSDGDPGRSHCPINTNEAATMQNSSSETIRQRNRSLSLLLSSPPTSSLIPLDETNPTPLNYFPRPSNGTHQFLASTGSYDPLFSQTSESQSVYDPSRGALLRREAELANPFRDRLERSHNLHSQERVRSRSPGRMFQPSGLPRYRAPQTAPWRALPGPNGFPREAYVPPRPNDLLPPRLPSPSSPFSGTRTSRRDDRLGHAERTSGEICLANDGKPCGSHQSQQPLHMPKAPGQRRPANRAQDTNEIDGDHLCEFAAPCRMNPSPDGMHYRKVVSHVFGRNKAVTKLFPLGVWVHYCRKHYQRARYRADQWPFTQCDLLLESLNRMESWNGVESFELILRRREQMRVGRESEGEALSNEDGNVSSNEAQEPGNKSQSVAGRLHGRKHPTAIIAPVPDWLRRHIGEGKSFAEVRRIIEMVRSHMTRLRHLEMSQQPSNPSNSAIDLGSPRRAVSSNCKRRRQVKPASQVSGNARASKVRFPDVEILPRFKPWVKEAALRQRSAAASSLKRGTQKDSEQSVSGGGFIMGEIQDTSSATSRAESSRPANGNLSHNGSAIHHRRSEPSSTVESDGATASDVQPHIGRAGTNRGQSERQQRRSERVYIKALDRVSRHGSVKKPGDDSKK